MLSEEKLRLMIRLSNYESGQGKKDLYRTSFYRSDYIHLQVLKTVVAVTISLVLMLVFAMLYRADYLLTNVVSLNYPRIISMVVLIYLLLIFSFIGITIHTATHEYEESRKRVKIYQDTIDDLMNYYDEEETDVSPTGTKG